MLDQIKGFIQLGLVILFIAGSFIASKALETERGVPEERDNADRSLFVETQDFSPGPYQIQFETTGIVDARARINVAPEISGRVVAINDQFFEGGTFEANEVLFEVEPLDFELEIERLKGAVATARTAFNVASAETEAATREWKMINPDKPVPFLVARRPQKDEAWAALKAAKAQLKNAELDLARTKFSLPYDGRVISANLEIGQYVAAGQSYGEVFNMGALEVQATLEDQQLQWLFAVIDPKIEITSTQQGQAKTYQGVLKRGIASLDPQTRFAPISFGIKDENTDLLPGVFVDLSIEGPSLQGITVVPASAMQKEGVMWTLDDENTLNAFEPDIAFANNDEIAIKNFDGASRIVTSRVSGATEGMKAQTTETETTPKDATEAP